MSFILQNQMELFQIPHDHADWLIIRSGIRQYSLHSFCIPAPIVQKYFSYYKLLFWSGTHILESIEAGMIVRDNISFYVHYHGSLTRGKIVQKPDSQYRLSFRKPLPGFGDPIVLIDYVKEIKNV